MKNNNPIKIPSSVRLDTELIGLLSEAKHRYSIAGIDITMSSLIRIALKRFGMQVKTSKEISLEMEWASLVELVPHL